MAVVEDELVILHIEKLENEIDLVLYKEKKKKI
jgi:hypothetical protein